MPVRVTLIAIALAVLALAGPRQADRRPAGLHARAHTSGLLHNEPAPDPVLPSVVSAAVVAPATVQALPCLPYVRQERPGRDSTVAGGAPATSPDGVTRRHAYPLLI